MIRKLFVTLVVAYQKILSPWLGPHCRFYPSCSEWTRQAIGIYGPAKGIVLGLTRILRCHPFHPGGYEPLQKLHG